MARTLRGSITGTYTRENINDMTAPTAWTGTVDADTRREQEADLAELVAEIRDMFARYAEVRGVVVLGGEVCEFVGFDEELPKATEVTR